VPQILKIDHAIFMRLSSQKCLKKRMDTAQSGVLAAGPDEEELQKSIA
jgi:hypothetical protein